MKVEVYHYPLIPDKIETILINDLKIGITTSNIYKDKEAIDLTEFLDKDKLLKYEDDIDFDKHIFDELINYAISNLKRAKSKHDIVESYYVPNMYFDEINKLKDELIQKILKYKNE